MADADIAKQRVMIVDDSKIVRATIGRLIRTSFDVREEVNGEAGWKAIESDPSIVVVFSDIQMPELDGFGLLERIRKSEDARIRNIPLIIISGDEDESTKMRAREAGANDFIAKTTDGAEILSRIDNLLRLMETRKQLEASRQVAEQAATQDPLTGTLTPNILIAEGQRHYSLARRHARSLSALGFRMETYGEISASAGKAVADQMLARVAKLVQGTLRAEDSMGRVAESTFAVITAEATAEQVIGFARRIYGQLDKAQVTYGDQVLKVRPTVGVAALDVDQVDSIQALLKLAMQRMQQASAQPERIGAPAVQAKPASALSGDAARAVQIMERMDIAQLGDANAEAFHRLLPFMHAMCKHLNVDVPFDKIVQALKGRGK